MAGWSMSLDAWLWMGTWILFLTVLVWALVREPQRSNRDEAMEIVRARLARGEINPDEFEQIRKELEAHNPGGLGGQLNSADPR